MSKPEITVSDNSSIGCAAVIIAIVLAIAAYNIIDLCFSRSIELEKVKQGARP